MKNLEKQGENENHIKRGTNYAVNEIKV